MRKSFKVFLFFLLLYLNIACFAAGADTSISVFKLKDGHTVLVKEVHANPIVTIDTWVKTGTAMETEKNNGVSHFLEHLMFKGTTAFKAGEFDKILEDKGARCNAATSKDFTHYYVTIASKYVDTALALHADMLQYPLVPQAEMDKERKVVEEEIRRSDDSPQRALVENLFDIIFSQHPYKMETLGTMQTIEGMTRDDVMGYYREKYVPSNLVTVIVGDVNTKDVLEKVKKDFNANRKPLKPGATAVKHIQPFLTRAQEKIGKGDYKTGYILLGYKGVPISNIKESYALDMAASILGGSESSRLYQTLKQDKNLVTSISASHYSLKDDSVFLVDADFEPEKYQAVKAAIQDELKTFRENPVTDEELKRAKTLARRGFMYDNESVENISESLGYCMAVDGNIDCYNRHLQYIDAVTPADIKNAVKKYLDPSKVATSVLLPKDTPVNNVATTNAQTIKDSTRAVLGNGLVLITTKNTSNDIIAMNVFFRGGKFLESKPGVASLVSGTLMYGTKNRPYKELIKELEDLGITLNASASNDYFEISMKSTKDDFDKGFEILADVIKNPTFEEKYIQENKDDILAGIKKSRDVPMNVASEKFVETMYKGHPYGRTGSVLEANIASINRNDIVNYWKNTFIPENMVVSASGNIDHQQLADKLTSAFLPSGRTPPKANYSPKDAPVAKFPENKIINTNSNSNAAWILIGWPVGNIRDDKEMVTFKVINGLLSGGLSSRLHNTFREKQGLSYAVGSSYSPFMDRGHFVFYIGTEPKNVELVRTKFLEEIRRIKTEPLTQAELEGVKSKLIGQYALSQETNEAKSDLMGKLEVIDKKFGFSYDFPDMINRVTTEDIITTANKYFNDPYIMSVVAPSDVTGHN